MAPHPAVLHVLAASDKRSKSSSQGYLLSTEKLHNKYAILIALNLVFTTVP